MDTRLPKHRVAKRGLQAVAVAALLSFSACGGGSDSATSESESDGDKSTVTTGNKAGSDTTEAGPTESVEPVLYLPLDAEAPSGFRAAAESCRADPSEPDPDGTYRTWIGYGVPEGWKNAGFSAGGSGGPHDNQALKFDVDDGNSLHGMVSVDVEWDDRHPDGTILDSNGDPWETFDYEVTYHGDTERTVEYTYDEVGTVDVGDGAADLYFFDPSQAPDDLGTTAHYKARVDAYELPQSQATLDESTPFSFVVTIEYDTEDESVTKDQVEQILGSLMMPQCTWDHILGDAELRLGVDLDGDGHARNADDAQEEMQENLDAMRDNLPPEAQKQYDEMREQLEEDG